MVLSRFAAKPDKHRAHIDANASRQFVPSRRSLADADMFAVRLLYLRKSAFICGWSVSAYFMTAVLLRSKVSATLTMMTRPRILCWK
jgi:hypothetical protein